MIFLLLLLLVVLIQFVIWAEFSFDADIKVLSLVFLNQFDLFRLDQLLALLFD